MITILLIGQCGSGKTYCMKKIIQEYNLDMTAKIKSIHYRTNKKISVLGKYTGHKFDGSDRLSMSVMKDVQHLKRLQQYHKMIIIAEGDRFMNKTFISTFKPIIIKMTDDGLKGRQKRKTEQSERQIKSIKTRVNNIKEDILVNNSNEALKKIKDIIDEDIKVKETQK